MKTTLIPLDRALLLVARLRLILAVAGVAWLLGYSPSIGGRITAGLIVVLVLALDVLANAANEPRPTGFGRKGGAV
jgi:hypothetical protein